MRKAFLHIYARLGKSENEELRSTLKFLTNGKKSASTFSSIFGNSISELSRTTSTSQPSMNTYPESYDKEDKQYIENVVKLLNSNLTLHNANEQKIRVHYDTFYNQLKNVLQSTSPLQQGQSPSKTQNMSSLSSKELLNKLLLSQLTESFSMNKASKIILSKQFNHFKELWSNITLFSYIERLEISLLIYYRTKNPEINARYNKEWIERFDKFTPAIQRVFWRCLYQRNNIEESKKIIYDTIVRLDNWGPSKIITLYQSLFEIATVLPQYQTLSRNQELFITTLRTLAPYKEFRKYMIKIVKLSMELKLINEQPNEATEKQLVKSAPLMNNITTQYKFATSLNLILHDLYNGCQSNNKLRTSLIPELEDIFKIISSEEEEIKTQLSLRYT
ncbi:similar to Saccharomyces cerevisiae YJL147C Mitochondrial protein of unknown function [Maudiozyma barnettii]|uniref:Uncharacterized protein n=1 Tax=Maudiozyma barnettii TaxID=61262 RepID=A0A8H2VGB5_9SACH|nr:Smt1p [Kazachstania barnettii]CAB4255124.1 similar to Saccharomyces cerevisiae YJL147C Mitochondrial protein of unknown function [Kazachstania barnettii]CAD1783395.1 similar to Saccharomyces cerevisiae YJL147C Mitochondrial protein of unknown function [Kazachstania barnettii]